MCGVVVVVDDDDGGGMVDDDVVNCGEAKCGGDSVLILFAAG